MERVSFVFNQGSQVFVSRFYSHNMILFPYTESLEHCLFKVVYLFLWHIISVDAGSAFSTKVLLCCSNEILPSRLWLQNPGWLLLLPVLLIQVLVPQEQYQRGPHIQQSAEILTERQKI